MPVARRDAAQAAITGAGWLARGAGAAMGVGGRDARRRGRGLARLPRETPPPARPARAGPAWLRPGPRIVRVNQPDAAQHRRPGGPAGPRERGLTGPSESAAAPRSSAAAARPSRGAA